jgi:UDP-3-O-[3-hydroxymyristoyl] glucosamine N-acyltransferase
LLDPSAVVDSSTRLPKKFFIAYGDWKNCEIGKRVRVHPNATIYDNVTIETARNSFGVAIRDAQLSAGA